ILVEFRAFDTLGELSVLGMAAIVIAAVVTSMPRHPFPKGTHPRPFGQSQLNSIPLRVLLKVLVPALYFLSFMVFMRGHNNPGG
ncbi:MnhB domain-containing protein, partial [Salmonella enterica subsp. enterica serovar Derby]